MYLSKLKTFLIFYGTIFIFVFIISITKGLEMPFEQSIFLSICFIIFPYMIGLHKPLIGYFDKKYWEKEDEKNFQINLRRTIQEKSALSQIDNENLHYQNQLRIEYIAQVAQIHLQSNQYLANMYQQAIINNSTQNELTAQRQLLELEAELKKQGLI